MKIIAKFTSMAALKAAIQKEMYEALDETVEDSFLDFKENTGHFYDSPEGRYKRTGQLRDSTQLDSINYSGDSAVGQISVNTSTQYDPSGRDTFTIYNYAEDNSLLGNGNFWQKTQDDIEKNIDKDFGKHFDKA